MQFTLHHGIFILKRENGSPKIKAQRISFEALWPFPVMRGLRG